MLALYLFLANIKGISAMRLHRKLDLSYASGWHLPTVRADHSDLRMAG